MFGRHFIAEPPQGYAATQAKATPTGQVLPEHEVALLCLSVGLPSHAHAAMLTKLSHSEEDRRKQELKALTVSGSHAKTFTFGQKRR